MNEYVAFVILWLYLMGAFLFYRTAYQIVDMSDEDGAFAVNVQIPPKWYHTAFWFFFVPYWQFTGQTIDE
jgi:hypothetical protein